MEPGCEPRCGIYQFRNVKNGKIYVGQSRDMDTRHSAHVNSLRGNRHNNVKLQRAWNKYGESAFVWSVLEECPESQLSERERYWIAANDSFHNGYNMTTGGEGSAGRTQSLFEREVRRQYTFKSWKDESVRNSRLASLRRVSGTPEYRAKLSRASQAMWDSCPQEKRDRWIARLHSESSRKNARAALIKLCQTESVRKRLEETSRAAWSDPRTKEKWRKSREYLHDSTEYLSKLSVKARERWNSEEYRNTVGRSLTQARKKRTEPVVQMETGVVFPSMQAAAASLGKSGIAHICDCCYGKRNTAFGFHWRFANGDAGTAADTRKTYSHGRVLCVETGQIFPSAKAAAESVDRSSAGITECCNGNRVTCGGFHWKRLD